MYTLFLDILPSLKNVFVNPVKISIFAGQINNEHGL